PVDGADCGAAPTERPGAAHEVHPQIPHLEQRRVVPSVVHGASPLPLPLRTMNNARDDTTLLEVRSAAHTSELQSRFDLACRPQPRAAAVDAPALHDALPVSPSTARTAELRRRNAPERRMKCILRSRTSSNVVSSLALFMERLLFLCHYAP